MDPVPSAPRPPPFDTAIASSGVHAVPIPAQKIGYRNPKAAINALARPVGIMSDMLQLVIRACQPYFLPLV